MTSNRTLLAREALHAAQSVRARLVSELTDPICIYDTATKLNVDVWFQAIGSLEGIYSQNPKPTIIVGSERPSGRQVYTCAHELGHHVMGHGSRLTLLQKNIEQWMFDPHEYQAQAFAGFLLAPKIAVNKAFHIRGISTSAPTPEEIYEVACFFGLGYESLIYHLTLSLSLFSAETSKNLLLHKPSAIRSRILGCSGAVSPLVVVNENWRGRPIDVEVGQLIYAPDTFLCEGNILEGRASAKGKLWAATLPGICRLYTSAGTWAAFVRITRKHFSGRSQFRNLPEAIE